MQDGAENEVQYDRILARTLATGSDVASDAAKGILSVSSTLVSTGKEDGEDE